MTVPSVTPEQQHATAADFLAYFQEHPLVESQYVQQVLGASMIEQLVEQPDGLEPAGYTMLVHQVIDDHQRGVHGITGEPVPLVVRDNLHAFNYLLEMMGWARNAVGPEFGAAAYDFYNSARQAARADENRQL
ncbi:MAG TPA: hypothetical protein VGO07_00800 [Candidatus Saccharimonadales bacterium]|jgi:hypothetical protein|nr:hypothetical protein [Candidatus Saccharimonadales bacterium]